MDLNELLESLTDEDYKRPGPVWSKRWLGELEVLAYPPDAKGDAFWAIMVPSDSSQFETYTVIREMDGSLSCDCKGFYYRQYCKHTTKVKAVIAQLSQH